MPQRRIFSFLVASDRDLKCSKAVRGSRRTCVVTSNGARAPGIVNSADIRAGMLFHVFDHLAVVADVGLGVGQLRLVVIGHRSPQQLPGSRAGVSATMVLWTPGSTQSAARKVARLSRPSGVRLRCLTRIAAVEVGALFADRGEHDEAFSRRGCDGVRQDRAAVDQRIDRDRVGCIVRQAREAI